MVTILSKYIGKFPPAVIHCFTGTKPEAEKYIEMGFYIGLTGYLWKDRVKDGVRHILQEKVIPINRLMVETDSPYMYPNTRGAKLPEKVRSVLTPKSIRFGSMGNFNRNEPCCLPVTVELISAFMEAKPEDVGLQTSFNALKVFGLNSWFIVFIALIYVATIMIIHVGPVMMSSEILDCSPGNYARHACH